MSKGKKTKAIISTVSLFYILNQFSFCAYICSAKTDWLKSYNLGDISVSYKDSIIENKIEDKSLSGRDYLTLANSIAHKYTKGGELCRHIADATYDTYNLLVKKNGRSDLKGKVRVVTSGINGEEGHMWMELLENGQWVSYEPIKIIDGVTLENVKQVSQDTKEDKSKVDTNREKEYQTIPGKEIFIPTIKSAFLNGGVVGYIWEMYRK